MRVAAVPLRMRKVIVPFAVTLIVPSPTDTPFELIAAFVVPSYEVAFMMASVVAALLLVKR